MMSLRVAIAQATGLSAARKVACGLAVACLMIASALAQDAAGGAARSTPAPAPASVVAPTASPSAAPEHAGPPPDLAFGAYQRGLFLTALEEALKRVKETPTMRLR